MNTLQPVHLPFGAKNIALNFPENVEVLSMGTPVALENPGQAVQDALDNAIGSPGLDAVIAHKKSLGKDPSAVIVISDNTRPVPYRGESGILWPIVERLLKQEVRAEKIMVLVATGMHRGLTKDEIGWMIDARVLEAGVRVINHDCQETEYLTYLGKTRRGSETYINRRYLDADIKILTGLVESHFMAGASGGRKSICPGIIGEASTFVFHGAPMMADPNTTDLKLAGNPCHEESFEVASKAGADFIVNVTLDHEFNLTGVFAGHLKDAHEAAVEHLKTYTAVPWSGEYDVVLTHAGFVGINHYQAAKAGTVAARIVKPGGHVLMVADTTDTDVVGSLAYRTVLQILKLSGPDALERTLLSPDWKFIPEQWQVQMWARLFKKIPLDHFHYYSPQFTEADYRVCAGERLAALADVDTTGADPEKLIPELFKKALAKLFARHDGDEPLRVAYLKDGPYGIPLKD
ncbi:nickel-dependent lactate racemase [Cerasicoccus fimbriatus]|uniref:nickel-dependent lactate racemase n=1 Tax=Cerasicoccus fimbriatus TaxID=3014554 RepID=UPI0022B3B86F|nr:nickel-dependent lactate racemase [Cerasicoccus sp. TK19100]